MNPTHSNLVQPGFCGWRQVNVPIEFSTMIVIDVFVCAGHRSGPLVLVTAGVHGDEYEGPLAIGQFADTLSPKDVSGTVYLVPVANPFAFGAGTRVSSVDGLNLARVFPGKEDGLPTERLAHFLFHEFASKADYLIDLHSGGVEYEFLPVAGFYGEPKTENASFQAARRMGLSALWQLPETAGVLSREAARAGKVAIGAEYLGAGRVSEEGVRAYARGIRRCLELWQVLEPLVSPEMPESRVFNDDWLVAPATGIFRTNRKLGDNVRAGEELATIGGYRGEILAKIVAPHAGVILGLRSKAYITTGNWAVLLARD
jgi:N-alpha-acetyl-L-2,4-diaminobutyrate deacetylase